MEKLRMLLSRLGAIWPFISEAAYQFLSFTCKGIIAVLAIIGFLYCWTQIAESTPPRSQGQSGFKNIILDEARLVRCKTIDRSQPSCTLLSDCDDQVDRCVVTFEILHRPLGPADALPLEP